MASLSLPLEGGWSGEQKQRPAERHCTLGLPTCALPL